MLYLQFLLLLGLPLPDNVLYSCFPCCFLLRSLGRDSYRLLTDANWLLDSAVRQSIGAFRDTSRCICLLLQDDSFYRGFPPRFLLCCRTASGRPFCRCLLIFLRHIRFRRNAMLIIIPLVKRAYFPHSQGGPIPNGILCRPGDFFFRIIAGRIRLLRLPVRRLFRFAPDKVSLHLLLSGIHHWLILPLPCLDFRQWRNLLSGLTGKPPLAGTGGHELVELGVLGEAVDKGHQGAAVFNEAGPSFHIGDVVHLLIGDVQESAQLFPVRCRLIQHDNEFGVGKHGAGLNGIQQVLHILGDGSGEGVALSELPPCGVEEGRGELIFKHHMEFVDEYMGPLAFFPVQGHTIQHGVCNDQQPGGLQLRTQAMNVRVHAKSLKKAKAKLKELTSRSSGRNARVVMQNVKVYIRGWLGYFGIASMKKTMQRWDEWLRRRFRSYIWKQWKLPRTRVKNLMKLGMPQWQANRNGNTRKGYWAIAGSGFLQHTITNERLAQAGYYSILDRYESLHLCD